MIELSVVSSYAKSFSNFIHFFVLIDFPIHIDRKRMGLSIMYSKGSQVGNSKILCSSVPGDCFYLSKLCRP